MVIAMKYVLLRYRGRPPKIVRVASTPDPNEAVGLAREWRDTAPDDGLIVAIDGAAVIDCLPRAA